MLSAQIDELRKLAEYYDDSEVASIMRYAADTIWQLRESVHRERAEADTLRTQLADVTESMGRVEERCAKLRELARELHSEYRYLRVRFHRTYVQQEERMRAIERRMRELGVEVDG